MKTAVCPSCEIRKRSAATSRDGLCDECAGRPHRTRRAAINRGRDALDRAAQRSYETDRDIEGDFTLE